MVSLFPRDTFNQRTNGLRPDLANMLVGLKPGFLRFPGGCWVEGETMATAYRWKRTIGDPADRANVWNLWGYYSHNGLGFHEFLQLAEDLGAEPLFVINVGMSHSQVVPLADMGPYVQDALDAIEYANGPADSTWGAQRAANGHPAPFRLRFMEIGNENSGTAYNDRYALFYDAIKARYPEMELIADVWGGTPTSRPLEIIDEHYYSDPAFFARNATRYDSYSRSGPKIYVGEYAVTSGAGAGNLAAALGEAAFMTGIERNSDIVTMASYAPLFAHVSNKRWNPDLIYFDSSRVYGSPSYYVQQMFAENRGDVVLPTTVSVAMGTPKSGKIGLGTWNTQAAFSNLVVTAGDVTLYQSDFSQGTAGWTLGSGTWTTSDGVLSQTAGGTDRRAVTGSSSWTNYSYSLKARKLGGSEGFLILFHVGDDNNLTWWNIGGWNNTLHAIERIDNGMKSDVSTRVPGQVETGRWYDVRIVVEGFRIRCYLDQELIHDVTYPQSDHGGIGLGTWNTQAAYSNIAVRAAGQTLYQSDFSQGAQDWRIYSGTWSTAASSFQQTAGGVDRRALTGNTNWADYTLSLQARKLGGSEGFLILFNVQDDQNLTWWNIGGWNNTQHAIERMNNGAKSILGSAVSGSVNTAQWYDIRIEMGGARMRCYLDNALIHDVSNPLPPPFHTTASFEPNTGRVLLKTVNVSSQPLTTVLDVTTTRGLTPAGTALVLTSPSPADENSFAQPANVAPVTNLLAGVSSRFTHTFPANSLSVLRLQARPDFPVGLSLDLDSSQQQLAALSIGIPVRLSSFITNSVSVSYTVESPSGVLAQGTLTFYPGDLRSTILLDLPTADEAILRITLSNPVNGQLQGLSRAYFVPSLNTPQEPPRLAWARFPDETLLFWTDPTATLLSAPTLAGPWSHDPAPSPFHLVPSAPSQFYRLERAANVPAEER